MSAGKPAKQGPIRARAAQVVAIVLLSRGVIGHKRHTLDGKRQKTACGPQNIVKQGNL